MDKTMSAVFPQKHLTDLNEWRRLGEAGIFAPESHVQLIEGEILHMSPIGSNHAGHTRRLNKLFTLLTADKALVSIQNPIQLGDLSEPEPDLVLLRPENNFYSSHHPKAEDVLLLIEVSDSTLNFDLNRKMRLYAAYNIPEYWVVNLLDNCLEIFRQPQDGDYLQTLQLKAGDRLNLVSFPDLQIEVSAVL
jgi:Uma2 family endonuclease